jgi:flagellin-like protein
VLRARTLQPRWRHRRRGISSVIATVFLVGITVIAGILLFAFRPKLPPPASSISYYAAVDRTTRAYGDGTDVICVNGGSQPCWMPVIEIIITDHSPAVIPLTSLYVRFICNGTNYLYTSFESIEVNTSSGTVLSAHPPTLGLCGSWNPQSGGTGTAFDRLLYFDQINPGSLNLQTGDVLVLYTHQFEPPFCHNLPCWLTPSQHSIVGTTSKAYESCPEPGYANGGNALANGTYELTKCDDDFHGAPYFCYTTLNACYINIVFLGTQFPATVQSIPLYGLAA